MCHLGGQLRVNVFEPARSLLSVNMQPVRRYNMGVAIVVI